MRSPLPQGSARVHEPRRADCPWCGSARLRNRLRTGDLRRHRPGLFTVDECRDCGHTFQNPRLTAEGLAFYRRTVRGAPRDPATERVLALHAVRHRRRARPARCSPSANRRAGWTSAPDSAASR
ncbi:hypothetical protein GCM10023238_25610 [Streptomyces heliomycini]